MFLRKEYKSKSDVFSNELDIMSSVYGEYLSQSFNSDFIGHDFNYLLELIHNKIFIEPASSSGKYHPDCSRMYSGLIRHTKLALHIFDLFFNAPIDIVKNLFNCMTEEDKINSGFYSYNLDMDSISKIDKQNIVYGMIALIFHDCMKYGKINKMSSNTQFLHPIYAKEFILENAILSKHTCNNELKIITDCIASHMGIWNRKIMPIPRTQLEILVHFADLLSSRKNIMEYLPIKTTNQEFTKFIKLLWM